MRILSQRCICPACRQHFSAFLADCEHPQRDEVDPSQRALLCVMCERAFINSLYEAMRKELNLHGELSAFNLRVSALLQEAQRPGEPGPSAPAGTDQARRVSSHMQGVSDRDFFSEVSECIPKHVESTAEEVRESTVFPPDPVGEEGVM